MRAAIGFIASILLTASLAAQEEEHRAFIGITIGPSIPIGGGFADKAEIGYTDTFVNFGAQRGEHWGLPSRSPTASTCPTLAAQMTGGRSVR